MNRKKGWMPANQRAECDFIYCIAGQGLVGGGCCFLKGEWWNPKCLQFKRDVVKKEEKKAYKEIKKEKK